MSGKINNELLDIIKKGEGVTTEFKESKNKLPKNSFETVCAFLNRNGGNIFLGIKDDGTIVGVDKDAIYNMGRDFVNLCDNNEKLNLTAYLVLNDYEIDGKIILHTYIPESSNIHRTANKYYDRGEDGDYEVKSSGRIANIYLRKQSEYTENKIYPYVEMSDLRSDLIERDRKMAKNNKGPDHPWINMNDEEIIKNTDLYGRDMTTGKEGIKLEGKYVQTY